MSDIFALRIHERGLLPVSRLRWSWPRTPASRGLGRVPSSLAPALPGGEVRENDGK